jgi:hypothetical protein
VRPAFVASRKAFVDAIAIVVVGYDEDATVGQCSGGCEYEGAGKEYGSKSHEAPKRKGTGAYPITPKTLIMINHAAFGIIARPEIAAETGADSP